MSNITTVDDYIAQYPAPAQEMLQVLRTIIRVEAPDAIEKIAYDMPSYRLNGNLVHFAAFTRHVRLYGALPADPAIRERLNPYLSGKGTLQFPLGEPMPLAELRRAIRLRVAENCLRTE